MAKLARWMGSGAALCIAATLTVPSPGWAQAAKGKKAPGAAVEIEEITVTAQKREESLQETPISVTAITAAALEEKGITDTVTLGTTVPNLNMHMQSGDRTGMVVGMRGVSQAQPDPSFPSKVGLYVDGSYIAYMKGSNFEFEDIERVEVLRGPQGTLYGRNTIAGALNFITKKPTENREITLSTEIGNFNAFKARMTVNAPLIGKNGYFQSDALGTLSLRETIAYRGHDNYYRNGLTADMPQNRPVSGASGYINENHINNFTAVRWQPSKAVTVDYAFEYHRRDDRGDPVQLTYLYPDGPLTPPSFGPFPNPFYAVPYVLKGKSDVIPDHGILITDFSTKLNRNSNENRMHMLTAAWDLGDLGALGAVTLKSISHYRDMWGNTVTQNTGTPFSLADFDNGQMSQTWSEELQMIGTAPRLHYVLGGYYFGDHTSYYNTEQFFGGVANLPYRNLIYNRSYAGFGQATWTPPILSDKLSLTAGLRFTKDQAHMTHFQGRAVDQHSTDPGFVGTLGKAFGGFNGAGAPGISPVADVSYQWTNDLMTYFRFSRGYAAGGLNGTSAISSLFLPFKPEHMTSYDVGIKSQWLDNRLRINANGFFMQFKDLQENVFHASATGGVTSVTANVESAEMWGTEFEATVIPLRGLEGTASYSFLAPKYTEWKDQAFDANGLPIFDAHGNPVLESVANKRSFPDTPQHQINLGLTYTAPPTTTGTFSAHIEVYWRDLTTFQANNESEGWQHVEAPAYALVAGQVSFVDIPLEKGTLDLAVFSRNMLDRKYRSYGIDFSKTLGFAENSYGDPRTFGLRLTYNFSES